MENIKNIELIFLKEELEKVNDKILMLEYLKDNLESQQKLWELRSIIKRNIDEISNFKIGG